MQQQRENTASQRLFLVTYTVSLTTNPLEIEKAEKFKVTQIAGLGRGQRIFTNICKSWAATQWAAVRRTLGEHRGALWEQCAVLTSWGEGHWVLIDTLSPSHSRDGMSLNRNYENLSVPGHLVS